MSTVAMNPGTSDVEARTAAIVSGVALLVMAVIAGVGYVFDSVVALLDVDFGFELALFTFVGEVVFIFWLLIRGRRVS